jgi:general secretion pathway protein H
MRATLATGSRQPCLSGGLRSGGFTLIELLVVLAILVMMVSLMPLALDHVLPARRVEETARQTLATVREAQSDSIATGRALKVAIEAGERLRAGDRSLVLPKGLKLGLIGPEAQPLTELMLFPDGSSSGADLVVTDGVRQRTVRASALSGRISLLRHD